MAKIQISTGDQDKTINTNSVWDRIIDLENTVSTLPSEENLEAIESQLAQSAKVQNGDIFTHFTPPTQPPATGVGAFVTKQSNYQYYIDTLWESLRTAFPTYITREVLGKDQTGTFDIYKYVFEPESYEKTIILNGATHGTEIEGMFAIYRFMHLVCSNHKDYPQLGFIRNRVRVVIVPILNPYGVQNATRENGRAVDLNRNMDANWAGTTGAKGASALSETESQIMNNVMSAYSDAVCYLDVHSASPDGINNFYYVFPSAYNSIKSFYKQIGEEIIPNAKFIMTENNIGTLSCHASKFYDMSSSTIEWLTGSFSTALDSIDITKSVEWLGNAIIQHLKYSKPSVELYNEPYSVFAYCNGGLSVTSTTYVEEPKLALDLEIPCDGILLVNGAVTIHNTDATAICYVAPVVIQEGNDLISTPSVGSQQALNEVYGEFGGKRGSFSFSNVFKVYPKSDVYKTTKFKFYWNASAGTMNLRRYRLSIVFIPTDKADRFLRYTTNGTANMAKDYPV